MLKTIDVLKEKIKQDEKVLNSILGISEEWKTTHYNALSQIINENLIRNAALQGDRKFEIGNSISAITLKRFFEDKISESTTQDLRFIKTLDKLCIFIGFESFNEFITHEIQVKSESNTATDTSFENIIKKCAELEFRFLEDLPNINLHLLEEVVIQNSPYYSRIKSYLEQLRDKKWILKKHPHSSYEVYGFETSDLNENLILVNTHEFWNLNFEHIDGEPHHYHTLNNQNYFLKPTEHGWKIWDNHNPNAWELTEKI